MIVTLYRADDGGLHSIETRSQELPEQHFAERGLVAKAGEHPETYLHLATGRVRKLKRFKPAVAEGGISRLPGGTQLVRDHAPLDTLEKAGGVSIGAEFEEPAEIELRHPHYQSATVTVPCGGKRARRGKRIELQQDRDELRARHYASLREQCGAFQKILKAILPALAPEVLAAIDPDALAVLASVDDVKTRFPKS
jgi:hypothetical protein